MEAFSKQFEHFFGHISGIILKTTKFSKFLIFCRPECQKFHKNAIKYLGGPFFGDKTNIGTVFPGIEGAALNFFFTWNCGYN